MNLMSAIGRFCLTVAAAAMMFYAYQYSMSQAIHTVIESQPPAPVLADTPSFDTFRNCDLGLTLYGQQSDKPPCRLELNPPEPTPAPIATMSKADSEKATMWFMFAAIALPLALGGAALAFWMIRD